MAILMLAVLAVFVFIAYITGRKMFLSPWFLLCAMTFATFIIVLLNYQNWEVDISGKFILYLTTALGAFGVGTAMINLTQKREVKHSAVLALKDVQYKKSYPANLFLILSLLLAVFYIVKLIADSTGNSFGEMLRDIYNKTANEDYSPGLIFNQFFQVVRAIAYINTFRLFLKFFSKSDKISFIKIIIPIIIFFVAALITTDRNIFLRYGIYFVCLWMFFYYNNFDYKKGKKINVRIIFGLVVMAAVIFLLFFIMGKMKQYTSDFTVSLSIYGGSGLNNFNIWINNFDGQLKYGQSTFTQLITTIGAILKPFGISLQGSVNRIDPFIEYTSANGYFYSSNIYTALKPFVEDFGYFGVIIFPFLIGLFYQWLYVKAIKNKYSFSWIVYSFLIYPIIFFPILEQLFRRFHLGFIYELVWPLIIYVLVFGRNKIRVLNEKNCIQRN
ncbi:MAG: oligosaccharide repeat unit polymerase [Clostridia bacterium]|nr:oligosaccharide repeat unit polymerase [Clostridia bacterium]